LKHGCENVRDNSTWTNTIQQFPNCSIYTLANTRHHLVAEVIKLELLSYLVSIPFIISIVWVKKKVLWKVGMTLTNQNCVDEKPKSRLSSMNA
jgi:hypothetical protein